MPARATSPSSPATSAGCPRWPACPSPRSAPLMRPPSTHGMQAPLAALASQGVIVNYLDLNLIGDRGPGEPRRVRPAKRRRLPDRLRHHQSRAAQPLSLLRRPGPPDLGRLRDRRPLCGAPARGAAPPPGPGRGRPADGDVVRQHPARPARPLRRAQRRRRGRRPQLLHQRQHGEREPPRHDAEPALRDGYVRRERRRRI